MEGAAERNRRPIAVTREISSPAADVWAAISEPGNLETSHPFCERNPVFEWPGPESRDEVHYLNGRVFERRFNGWIDGVGYDLTIVENGRDTAAVSWRIDPVSSDTASLTISVRPRPLDHVPIPIRWIVSMRVRSALRTYLSSVVRGFEWFVTRGEPVVRDQFGRHPWFSAPRT